ncbi:hypothetical protein [Spiroplasma alleghenense]|uniref:Uncharacterized protein n=1 Tax=Spiroplasma alleghenense TaxID=216931 RepID=A0A345Z5C9_9MOLU|nr:hypothetical protein [Spiroplasma alleghenense]AXK51808.1 hypothetical protein SALLE_v1c11380 [Spiroplasma alleghenense]
MKKNIFSENNKIVMTHLRIHWKIILFFAIFWFLVGMSLMINVLQPFDENMKFAYIGPTQILRETANGSWGTTKPVVSQMLNFATFGAPGIIFFIIVLMTLNGRVFSKEINGGQINIWMTSAVSRTQIFYSKFMFIIFSVFIIFAPNFLFLLIISATTNDASKYFSSVILYGVQFFIFLVFISAVVTFIVFSLADKGPLPFIIVSLIALYILVTWVITLVDGALEGYEKTWMSYVKYFSLQSLIANPLNFSLFKYDESLTEIIVKDQYTYTINHGVHYKPELWFSIVAPIITIGITVGTVIGTNALFVRKDFNI